MKKYFFAILAIMLCPILLLAGCGSFVTGFERTTTNSTILDFYTGVLTSQNTYKNLVNGYTKTSLASEELTEMNTIFSNYSDLNNELLMTLPAVDYFNNDTEENNLTTSFYDLSTMIDSTLDDFNLYKKATNKYILKISGMGNNEYLPIVTTQNATDTADSIILSMGNAVQYDVSYSTISKAWSVSVTGVFYYPSEQDVPISNANGIKIARNDGQQKITIVYTDNSQTYSKVVEFGTELKTVTKYTGDITVTPNATSSGSYTYEMSSADFLGTYEFKFDSSNSYFYGKHTKSSGNYSFVECYNLKSNIFISKLNIIKTGNLNQSIELLISSDSANGKLKQKKYSGSFTYISDFTSISEQTFATLTSDEMNQTNPIYAYTFLDGGISCQSVGY